MEESFKIYDFTKMQRKSHFVSEASRDIGQTTSTSSNTAVSLTLPLDAQPMAETSSKVYNATEIADADSRRVSVASPEHIALVETTPASATPARLPHAI